MSKFIQSKAFIFGFSLGFLIFIGVNLYDFNRRYSEWCGHCSDQGFGYPFRMHEPGGLIRGKGILFDGLIADFLIAIIFSLGLGLIFKFIWSKIASPKLK